MGTGDMQSVFGTVMAEDQRPGCMFMNMLPVETTQPEDVSDVVLSSKDAYLDRYAEPDKGWTDRDESRWAVPYWDVDAGMAALLMLLTAVDEGLGACFFGVPAERLDAFRAEFGVPAEFRPVGCVSVGYPGDDDRRSPSLRRGPHHLPRCTTSSTGRRPRRSDGERRSSSPG